MGKFNLKILLISKTKNYGIKHYCSTTPFKNE